MAISLGVGTMLGAGLFLKYQVNQKCTQMDLTVQKDERYRNLVKNLIPTFEETRRTDIIANWIVVTGSLILLANVSTVGSVTTPLLIGVCVYKVCSWTFSK